VSVKDIIEKISKGAIGEGKEIKAGQCISSIAFDEDMQWNRIYLHEKNEKLRETRQHPNILLPGDKVTIPAKEPKEKEEKDVDTVYTYKRKLIPCGLQLRFTKFGKPRKEEKFELWSNLGKVYGGELDKDGILQVAIIQPDWKKVVIYLGKKREEYEFELGTIAPVTEPRGIQARLWNLGYYHDELTDEFTSETENAFRRFMNKNGILDEIDATLNEAAVKSGLALLVSVHGC
jgi:hypothetical protein